MKVPSQKTGSSLLARLNRSVGVVVVILALVNYGAAQTIEKAEYFFDVDPGIGNGTPLAIPSPSDEVTFTSSISTSGLAPGYHILFVRTKSSDKLWSLYEHQQFVIEVPIEKAEYFFDVDPGLGNGHPITVAAGQLSISPAIPTTGLADGEHMLFVRTRQAKKWSLSEPLMFYIHTRIVAAEYFIDTDPGFGNGTPIPIASPSHQVTVNATVGVGPLVQGDHYIFVRTKDIVGKWSFYDPQKFTVDIALPVELAEFKATATEDESVRTSWTTFTEINTSFFGVEYSEDGIGFSEFARVAAAGESKLPRHYSMLHQHGVIGNNYYRLRMVDRDGSAEYSKVVVARLYNHHDPVVYPNPAFDRWVIDFSKTESEISRVIDLFDLSGKKRLSLTTGSERVITMSREGLSNGVYLLRITSPRGIKVLKVDLR